MFQRRLQFVFLRLSALKKMYELQCILVHSLECIRHQFRERQKQNYNTLNKNKMSRQHKIISLFNSTFRTSKRTFCFISQITLSSVAQLRISFRSWAIQVGLSGHFTQLSVSSQYVVWYMANVCDCEKINCVINRPQFTKIVTHNSHMSQFHLFSNHLIMQGQMNCYGSCTCHGYFMS